MQVRFLQGIQNHSPCLKSNHSDPYEPIIFQVLDMFYNSKFSYNFNT